MIPNVQVKEKLTATIEPSARVLVKMPVAKKKWPTLVEFVQEEFKSENTKEDAIRKLEKLKQGKKRAEELITEFKLLVGDAELSMDDEADPTYLVRLFCRALNPRLKSQIVYGEKVPKAIKDWFQKAVQFDNNNREAEHMMNEDRDSFTSWRNYGRNRQSQRDPDAMDMDRLTIEERNDLMKRGACFFCKKEGHMAIDCQKKKKNYQYGKNKEGKEGAPGKSGTSGEPKKKLTTKDFKAHIRALNTEERDKFFDEMAEEDSKDPKDSDNDSDF